MSEYVWHDDNHVIHLALHKAELQVVGFECPGIGPCTHAKVGCVVDWFVKRFGLDCNIGSCDPTPALQVAWTFVGDLDNLDTAQVWVIPVHDPVFGAWRDDQLNPVPGED